MEFEGEYLNGERNIQGKEYNNDKLKYEGKCNKYNIKARFFFWNPVKKNRY